MTCGSDDASREARRTDLTIVYLKMRALAEAPQLMLSYRGESYRYRMAWDYFGAPWPEVKPIVVCPAVRG